MSFLQSLKDKENKQDISFADSLRKREGLLTTPEKKVAREQYQEMAQSRQPVQEVKPSVPTGAQRYAAAGETSKALGTGAKLGLGQMALGQAQALKEVGQELQKPKEQETGFLADVRSKIPTFALADKLGLRKRTAEALEPERAEERISEFEQSLEPLQEYGAGLTGAKAKAFQVGQQAPQVVGAAISPAASATGMGIGVGGQKARELEELGANETAQRLGGLASGLAEFGPGVVTGGFQQQMLTGKGGLSTWLLSSLFEGGEEMITEAIDPYINKFAANQELPGLKEYRNRIIQAGYDGLTTALIIGGLETGIGSAYNAVQNPTEANVQEATLEVIDDMVEKGTLPENVAEEITRLNPNKLSYNQLKETLESKGLDTTGTTSELRSRLKESTRQSEISQDVQEIYQETETPSQDVQEIYNNVPQEPISKDVQTIYESVGLEDGASMTMTLDELTPLESVGDPIDTMTKVLTETPKKIGASLSDKAERVYQEIFSKNVPFERIGGQIRTEGSNLNRLQGTIEYNVVGKQTDMQGNQVGKSVTDIFENVKADDKQALFDYALNKHNIDRWREKKPVFGETVSDITSSKKVDSYDQSNPEFYEQQQEISQYFKNLMDNWAVESGLVSEEMAETLQDRYPNYVPTYRAKDLPKTMMVGKQNVGQIIKKAKGGEDFILPIDQQMIALTNRTITNARRNELMNNIANAYEQGNSNVNRYVKNIKNLDTSPVTDLLEIGQNMDEAPKLKGDEYAVNFYTDGKPRQMVVNKSMYEALDQSISDSSIDKVGRIVKKYATNPFKNLITGYNPIFAASNIMRDVPTALTYSTDPVNMAKQVPVAVQEMLTNGDKFQQFKAMGGTREGLIGSDKEFKVPTMQESSKIMDTVKKANPIQVVGDVNNFTETLPRFAEYLNVLDKTGNPALAVYQSAELTTDFSRHGKLTKSLDAFVPYLNPSVQGIDKFVRSVKNDPLKTAVKGAAVITVPTIILDAINQDDEEYQKLSPRERNLYFNVPYTDSEGNRKFVRIPKSRELGVAFSSIYEWAARAARGEEVTGEEIVSTIRENFTPADINSPIWTPALKAFKQIEDPDAYETNYWGGLIVPMSQRKYSPGKQYDANSSGIAKAIGKQFDISPYVVDYLIKSYSGIVGQVVQPIGRDKPQDILAPISNKFINDPVFKANSVNEFYELLDSAKKEAQDYNKENNVPSNVVTPLEKKANAIQKISTELSRIRKVQKQSKDEDKIKELQIKMNELAEKAINKYK